MMKGYVWVLLLAMTSMECVAGFNEGLNSYQAQDYPSALREFLPLANGGNAHAQFHLGVMYYEGEGVPKDYSQAGDWYRKAAEQGYAEAQLALGVMYQYGVSLREVPEDYRYREDYSKAEALIRKAAEQGFAEAQFHLGRLYYKGNVVPEDYSKAEAWYRKAAAQGHLQALNELGWSYADDFGLSAKNLVLAHIVYNLAVVISNGIDTHAKDYRDNIASQLTPAQLSEAQELASQWVKGQPLPTITKTYQSSSKKRK